MENHSKIYYTLTDEAPALATQSWLPVVQAFLSSSKIEIVIKDISLAARVIAVFPEYLSADLQIPNDLAVLATLTKKPEANIIKLPNISASVPQLKNVIKELQAKGYALPDYPEQPQTDKEKEIRNRYDSVKGSAVNPVLREGNSDRRVPKAIKNYAKKNPHSMGAWDKNSKSHIATMTEGDFGDTEQSITVEEGTKLKIQLRSKDGNITILKNDITVEKGEVVDTAVMRKKKLLDFFETQIKDAKKQGVLFSLHMKATMMKVSDPIIFGHAVKTFFKPVFDTYGDILERIGVNVNNGFGNLLKKLEILDATSKIAIETEIQKCFDIAPDLAMVNSDKGITNFHMPNDIIIDASMPAMIRNSGRMWNKYGALQDTKAVIPDSNYASVYQATIDFCKKNDAFDPTTMGTVSNVGLMGQKAEEYGSHDKTFEISGDGTVEVLDATGNLLMSHEVAMGDIWRMCQVKDVVVKDWIQLALDRATSSNTPAVFWLNKNRPHDAELLKKVHAYLLEQDTTGLHIHILSPFEATLFTLERVKKGEDTISVTGNVLRDYLTDLFPILEVGTSAKMLSIVPLISGGRLFETGAGGSAPKHVEQFLEEGHLRWDSLGEFLALAVSLEHLSKKNKSYKAQILGETLNDAIEKLLDNKKSPSRKVGELDSRGSHFYLALYWAEALANQNKDTDLKDQFTKIYQTIQSKKETVLQELNDAQGKSVDIGGYYQPDRQLLSKAMRSSDLWNNLLQNI